MANNSSKLGLIKKALTIFFVQYHGIIPFDILKGYVHKYRTESNNIKKYGKRFFNPEIAEEYNQWLTYQTYEKNESKVDMTLIGNHIQEVSGTTYPKVNMTRLYLDGITSEYVCIVGDRCHFYEYFDSYVNECEKVDVLYFDHDYYLNEKRSKPMCKPDFSYDTLRGFNYIGNCWIVKTDLLKQFDGAEWNPYRWLLELSDQKIKFGHVSKIVYGDCAEIVNEKDTLVEYLNQKQIPAFFYKTNQKEVNRLIYRLKERPLVSIIIPTKDGKDVLDVCIQSIMKCSTYVNYEIIIADNGSTKVETKEYFNELQTKYSNIHVVDCDGPFNFSKINNQAIQHAQGKYYILLNNDTSIITSDWIEQMLSYCQFYHVGSVGVKLLYPDGSIQHGGVIAGKGGGFAHRYYRKEDGDKGYMYTLCIPNDVACCTAACLMISKEKYEEVGGMNEELTVQFNDVDLGLRLLEKGYFNVFLPDVQLVHYESKSRGIDKKKEAVKRYVWEVDYVQEHYKEYLEHDPFYNDNFDTNYDYMLICGKGSN